MTAEKIRKIEAGLGPCSCGGCLYINRVSKGKKREQRVLHYAVRCRDCGAWRGGIADKSTRVYFQKEEERV